MTLVDEHVMSWDLLVLRCEQERATCWDAWCADDGRPAAALAAIRAHQAHPTPEAHSALLRAARGITDARHMAGAAWTADGRKATAAGVACCYAGAVYHLVAGLAAVGAHRQESHRRRASESFLAAMIYLVVVNPGHWTEDDDA